MEEIDPPMSGEATRDQISKHTTPMFERRWTDRSPGKSPPEFLIKHPWIHRFIDRMVIGSTGVEFWSSVTFIVLGSIALTPGPDLRGLLLRILFINFPYFALITLVATGIVHLYALGAVVNRGVIVIRKGASVIEVTAWTFILFDMLRYYQWGSATSLGVLVILLFIGIFRRKYLI